MEYSRDILDLEVDFEDYPTWVEDNQLMFLLEIISASEELVHSDLEDVCIMTITIRTDIGGMKLVCNLNREDLGHSLEKVLEKCVESEEYELAQRVKNLQDYINGNNL